MHYGSGNWSNASNHSHHLPVLNTTLPPIIAGLIRPDVLMGLTALFFFFAFLCDAAHARLTRLSAGLERVPVAECDSNSSIIQMQVN